MIDILTPTRARPELCLAMIESCRSKSPSVRHRLFIDTDDSNALRYGQLLKGHATILNGNPGRSLGARWNALAKDAVGPLLMMGNDDLVFDTSGWDEVVHHRFKKAFPDLIGCLWCDDTINGPDHCAFPIISTRWAHLLGEFTSEAYGFFYHDTHIMDIAKRIGRTEYVPEVTIRHLYRDVPRDNDPVVTASRRIGAGDQKIFDEQESDRIAKAEILREAMETGRL